MAFYNRIIDLLKTQVGYHEGRSNGSWNNDQKYSKEIPGFGWSNYQAWCATFNTWIDWKLGLTTGAGDDSKSPCTASVGQALQWGKERGRFTEYPVIGAWIIFNQNEHTERCIGYDDTYVYSIGGNTNSNFSSQGDGVYAHKRLRTATNITGYVVPVFPDGNYLSPDPKWHQTGTVVVHDETKVNALKVSSNTKKPISLKATKADEKSGKANGNIHIAQHLLNANGFSKMALGEDLKEDGIYGPKTKTVVMFYQIWLSNRDHLGWAAADCDGYFGETSFKNLVNRYYNYVA